MFRPELIETSIVGINAASQQAVSLALWQSAGHRIAKCVLCDSGSNPCGDHFFFHPKFHYNNNIIVLLLLFLLPIAGSKAVCIANYETVTKPNLMILYTLVRVNKLRVATPGAKLVKLKGW